MKKLSSLLVSASLVCALRGYAADTHWGYTGADSPEKWGELDAKYATCKIWKSISSIKMTKDNSP
jgi:carbonic anhydrase